MLHKGHNPFDKGVEFMHVKFILILVTWWHFWKTTVFKNWKDIDTYFICNTYDLFGLVILYGISTILGYLMTDPVYANIYDL